MAIDDPAGQPLTAPYLLQYPYRRSLGPVLGRFFTALRGRQILGARTLDGRVLVPPLEYDPETGDDIDDLVPVSARGTVTTWAWVAQPRPLHPLQRPFAFALIRLDGADTAMLHAVDALHPEAMTTGMRVRARWSDAPVGHITDLACFEPEDRVGDKDRVGDDDRVAAEPDPALLDLKPVTSMTTPLSLDYTVTAGYDLTAFLRGIARKTILGRECPACQKVYVPARGTCPTCSVPTGAAVEVAHAGTITTFCVVNIPFEGQQLTPPYVCASVLLDGADIPIFHLVGGGPVEAVHMGMRVRAVWVPDEALAPTMESIRYFEPSGEPDAPFDSYKEHL